MQNVSKCETTDIRNELIDGKIVVTKIDKVYFDGILHEEKYRNNEDQLHRDANSYGGNGPAVIKYALNDNNVNVVCSKSWYSNGKKYREGDKPTYEEYYLNSGRIKTEEWEKDGLLHRDPMNGPAHITWRQHFKDEGQDEAFYFINGIEYPSYEIARINMMIQQLDTEDLKKCIAFINSLRKE